LGSLSKNLVLLVMLAVLPALAILLHTGMEQRRLSIEEARHDIFLLTHTMAEVQRDITRSIRQILSTLSLLPQIQDLDLKASSDIFKAVLGQNPNYQNITLTDLNGEVLASGLPTAAVNLADRKHVREAMKIKDLAAGEYIVSRVGLTVPAFAFAYPVLDQNNRLKAVLTTSIKLDNFSRFYDLSTLPEKSFVAATDYHGIRLFYYPPEEETNPIGKPIRDQSWNIATKAKEPGIFIGEGSDGIRRIFAFEQVRLAAGGTPYMYVWAAIPEAHILKPANTAMTRNLLIMLLTTVASLFIAWVIGKKTLISPIKNLVALTREFAEGNLAARNNKSDTPDEFGALNTAFHDMADTLMTSQRALRENEARFRLVMDSLDAVVYVSDMDTYEVLFINEHGRKIFGDITGKICWQSLQKGQIGPCPFCTNKYLLDALGKPGRIYTWEAQNSVSGKWFYIQDRAIKWVDGRIVRLEVATDITERKLSETKLAVEKERLAVTLSSIGDGVITTDTQGRVTLINKVAEMLTGWDSGEAAGRSLAEVFEVINEVTRQPCESPVDKVLASGNIVGLAAHTALISKQGREISIADSGAPIRDKDGKVIGVVLVFRDISEKLRTEQELIKVKKLESIGVLAGGIAHDFNNILVAILGNIDLSLRDANLTDETRKLLKGAVKASYQARDLTQQLLTFAKGGEPIKEAASVVEVVRDSANFVLRGAKVACRYFFPDDLWLVDIDKGQISQVVQNIILNASNAMPGGGVIEVVCENVRSESSMSIALPVSGNYVKMSIKDTGVGIPANVLDRIFDPYFSTKQQGSGLGLAISHSIISKHGGHIAVQSTPGVGTTFTVYLPASALSSEPLKKAEEPHVRTRKSRILVMDDEKMVRNILMAMLHAVGHEVLLAKDGMEAVQLYREAMAIDTPIDLIIMDLTIPGGMGGKEAVQEILAINPEAKVVVSSGYSNDPVMANFRDYGFSSAIAKPYQLSEITMVISQLLIDTSAHN
jgi:two-component system cell cycle sensor histidine kinase/response regulator CckA